MRFKITVTGKDGEIVHKDEVTAPTVRDAVNDLLGPTNANWWKAAVSVSVEGLEIQAPYRSTERLRSPRRKREAAAFAAAAFLLLIALYLGGTRSLTGKP